MTQSLSCSHYNSPKLEPNDGETEAAAVAEEGIAEAVTATTEGQGMFKRAF